MPVHFHGDQMGVVIGDGKFPFSSAHVSPQGCDWVSVVGRSVLCDKRGHEAENMESMHSCQVINIRRIQKCLHTKLNLLDYRKL